MKEEIHTVTGLTRRVRDALSREIGSVWVSGEVSNCRPAASGHYYFTLKDERAQLSCVLFRGDADRVATVPADGLEVQVFGKIDVYEARGQYQMIVRQVQETGAGRLQVQFEALKRKLDEEGLFDPARKRAIPRFPKTVAVVTSPTGAAIRDIINVLGRRAPWVHVIVFPVRVQGEGSAPEIAEAIRLVEAMSGKAIPVIDTLIVGRGGGSIEDLWSFNEEVVARAAAACELPVISAVGHEIDFTICDFVADLRAPTPSAAAEVAAPDGAEISARIQSLDRRLHQQCRDRLDYYDERVGTVLPGALTREPLRIIRQHEQSLDHLGERLMGAPAAGVSRLRERVDALAHVLALHRPETVLSGVSERVLSLRKRLHEAVANRITSHEAELDSKTKLLASLGPDATLARGFALVTDEAGQLVTKASQAKKGDRIRTRLAEGGITSEVVE